MTPEGFIKKHKATIRYCLKNHANRYDVNPMGASFEDYEADIMGDIFLWADGRDDLDGFSWRYVYSMVHTSFIKSWRARSTITFAPGEEAEISSISEFSEDCLANNLDSQIYYDRGGCTRFSVNPVYGPFPGFEDLESNDQSALVEFCNPRADNNTRRGPSRRLVDLILRKIGIESGDVHDYTTRRRT
jgi:hypothetical protein